jgi:hypothetical protein
MHAMTRAWTVITGLWGAVLAGPDRATGPASLPAADRDALMRLLCDTPLRRDGAGWVCGADNDAEDADPRTERRWHASRRGRFVAHDDEWLVSLAGPCIGGCPGESYVVRTVGGRWRVLREAALRVDDACLQVRGPDGLDRLVCRGGAGPHMGFMWEWLEVASYGGAEAEVTRLLLAEQGGECFTTPPAAEHREDTLKELAAGAPGTGTAFTVRLEVVRGPCGPQHEDGQGPVKVVAEHLLRFVFKDGGVAPDAATRALAERLDWLP